MTATSILTDQAVTVAGERLVLLPERAAYWPARRTLLAADLHWGKAASFRALAVPVPDATERDLRRLSAVIARTGAERLVILGDLFHARSGVSPELCGQVARWRQGHDGLAVELVRGNHDRRSGDPPADWGFRVSAEPAADGPFEYRHHPTEGEAGYVLAGHLHPAVTLVGAGRQRERLPCFWLGRRVGVLPSFGSFTGSAAVRPARGDRVYVVAGDQVVGV